MSYKCIKDIRIEFQFFVDKTIHNAKITLSQKMLFQNSVLNKLQAFYFRGSNNIIDTD